MYYICLYVAKSDRRDGSKAKRHEDFKVEDCR